MFYKSEGKIIDKNKIEEVLGDDFYNDLLETKDEIKLDRTIFGYFNRSFQVNEVLAKYNFFLKFFERQDMFTFLIQKKVQGKNKVTRDLSSPVIKKFNGYELIRPQLARQERIELIPINIVYEPIYDENIPVPRFFADQIYLAYRSYVGHFEKRKGLISNRVVRHCYHCKNFFVKNDESMKKYISICAVREGITYSFDNGQIINFQDNL